MFQEIVIIHFSLWGSLILEPLASFIPLTTAMVGHFDPVLQQ